MINTQVLEEIGFTRGEIKVYFSLLELGQITIGPLAKKSGVSPAKVYLIIEKLFSKGLCSSVIKSNTKYFEASNPKKIIEYLDNKDKKIKQEKEEIRKLIPQIEIKQKLAGENPNAQVYQGFEGMRTLYNQIIEILHENREDFIGFTLGEEEYSHKESEYFFDEYDTKRRALKIKTKLIGNIKQKTFMKKVSKSDKNISIRYVDYNTPTGLIIFGNSIAIINWQKTPMAFVIQSKQTADAYKRFFQDMWSSAKR